MVGLTVAAVPYPAGLRASVISIPVAAALAVTEGLLYPVAVGTDVVIIGYYCYCY